MKFYEILNELMVRHSLRAVDICNKSGLKKAYFSRLKNGSLLPDNYQTVHLLSQVMELTQEESGMLSQAYQAEKTDTKYSLAYKAFNKLYEITAPRLLYDLHDTEHFEAKNGSVIVGTDEVRKVTRKITFSASSLNIVFKPKQEHLCELFQETFKNLSDSTKIKWIVPLDETEGSSEHNMSSFVHSIPIALTVKTEPRGLYLKIDDYLNNDVFPYLLMKQHH